jgi:hypothetical protein
MQFLDVEKMEKSSQRRGAENAESEQRKLRRDPGVKMRRRISFEAMQRARLRMTSRAKSKEEAGLSELRMTSKAGDRVMQIAVKPFICITISHRTL